MSIPPSKPSPIKHLHFAAAVLLAAQHDSVSISELVMTYRLNGLGGDRACRKLIHRLQRFDLLAIRAGGREDRREKSVHITATSRALLDELRTQLQRLDL